MCRLTPRSAPLQLFIAQREFEDGQTSAEGQPDRAESDADDNEVSDADDEDTPARTASLGMGYKKPGTPDSLQRFMDEWSDDISDSSAGKLSADSRSAPKKAAKKKHARDEVELTGEGPSRVQPAGGQKPKKKNIKAAPDARVLEEVPMEIPPLRFMMPNIPHVAR